MCNVNAENFGSFETVKCWHTVTLHNAVFLLQDGEVNGDIDSEEDEDDEDDEDDGL